MQWDLSSDDTRPRALIMVSRELHCLLDLLNRTRMDKLRLDIPLIISNHPDAGQLAQESGIDFLHLPITPENKEEQEERLIDEIEENNIDFVVLARYMRIIGPEVCERMAGRIINIHHSFLPGFKGARPYHQAHRRGVKLIGATAHYVTADLDEGPIIEQDVESRDPSHVSGGTDGRGARHRTHRAGAGRTLPHTTARVDQRTPYRGVPVMFR